MNLDGKRKGAERRDNEDGMKIETLEEMKDSKKVLIIIFPRGGNGRLFSLRGERKRNRKKEKKKYRISSVTKSCFLIEPPK